jgi:predicted regulator of Ras-like GTPase activity (Roadblock/LC7/MglB family)
MHRTFVGSDEGRATGKVVDDALYELRTRVPDVMGVLVASVDGLPLAQIVHEGDPPSLAAMASTAAGLSKRIVEFMGLGGFAECVVRGDNGYLAVYSAGPVAVLAVIAAEGANLGRVHLEARRAATTIATALETGPC